MSYAEQFYGMMGNQALLYADNLAWFGTESYVYKSTDLMMKVIQNPVAMTNKVAAFYAYLWARAKSMKASDYFKKGTEISFYNTDLGRSFEATKRPFHCIHLHFVRKRLFTRQHMLALNIAVHH